MDERKDEVVQERAKSRLEEAYDRVERYVLAIAEDRWRLLVVLFWLIISAYFLFERWRGIQAFGLGDTDDNMRMMEVRAWLHGQGWFDLRQYRLNPPAGANIHWSRLVDLPIAGLIVTLRPLLGGVMAEKVAVTVAPLLPLLLLLFSLSQIVRRLVHPLAYVAVFGAILAAGSNNNMFMPLRIDHHGWQLALLALGMAGIADPKRARGGLVLGLASALSLTIGLEMIIYLALGGVAMVLFWVADADERERLSAYAVALGGVTAFGFLVFTSYANRLPVCDALSPVWLSDALIGSALMFGLARLKVASWKVRLPLALAAGLIVASFHALAWPNCLQRLEGVSPEVEQLWLSHVREARSIFRYDWRTAATTVALPLTGLIGWALLIWARRRDAEMLRRVLAIAVPALTAVLLLGWQTRTGPAAQMLAVPGAAAIVAVLLPFLLRVRQWEVKAALFGLLVVIGLGGVTPLVLGQLPKKPATKRDIAIGRANRLCNSMAGLRAVAMQPKGLVFTFVDLGPRLIAVTHHDAIAGPYHRNGQQILDIMHAFRGTEAEARGIIAGKYRADYLLTCPNMSTSTIFLAEAPQGFYGQLERGQVPGWLTPVPLPVNSPFRMWKVAR
ncbi:MAG: AcrB/AcrD/AcrF family protein [Sphingomicrobium sp.]